LRGGGKREKERITVSQAYKKEIILSEMDGKY